MIRFVLLTVFVVHWIEAIALAQPAAPPPTDGTFEPPRAKSSTQVPYPANAPRHDAAIVVTVKLLVDTDGRVSKAELVTAPQPPFDDAVLETVKTFLFEPATHNGTAVPVEITFTHQFQPPLPPAPPTTADEGPPRTSILRGRLIQLGTRAPSRSHANSPRSARSSRCGRARSPRHESVLERLEIEL